MNVEEALLFGLTLIVVALARWLTRPRSTYIVGGELNFEGYPGLIAVIAKYDQRTGTMTDEDVRDGGAA
jgi:hypothetical protein